MLRVFAVDREGSQINRPDWAGSARVRTAERPRQATRGDIRGLARGRTRVLRVSQTGPYVSVSLDYPVRRRSPRLIPPHGAGTG